MNKKLGRALYPGVWPFFLVMLGFVIPTALLEQYVLAGAEIVVILLAFLVYMFYRSFRRKEIQGFVQKVSDEICSTQDAKLPFPMALVRLHDGGIVYANDGFVQITGLQDALQTKRVDDILPGFNPDWLTSGKTEAPYDVSLGNRRYRIHGTLVRGDDPQATQMGLLYLTDLTELYQIRDEYVRSRPVVSIILVDNYDELTRNMTEGATSGMNARINNAIMKWSEGFLYTKKDRLYQQVGP